MIRAILLAALTLAACAAPPADQPSGAAFIGIDGKPLVTAAGEIDSTVQEALTADPEACAKAGGSLRPVCRMQKPMCLITFTDAGKSCTDGSQCASGRCTAKLADPSGGAASGRCAATNDPCGCYTRIEDGVAQPTICVD